MGWEVKNYNRDQSNHGLQGFSVNIEYFFTLDPTGANKMYILFWAQRILFEDL